MQQAFVLNTRLKEQILCLIYLAYPSDDVFILLVAIEAMFQTIAERILFLAEQLLDLMYHTCWRLPPWDISSFMPFLYYLWWFQRVLFVLIFAEKVLPIVLDLYHTRLFL